MGEACHSNAGLYVARSAAGEKAERGMDLDGELVCQGSVDSKFL